MSGVGGGGIGRGRYLCGEEEKMKVIYCYNAKNAKVERGVSENQVAEHE